MGASGCASVLDLGVVALGALAVPLPVLSPVRDDGPPPVAQPLRPARPALWPRR
jgi:hypothetical protein